jgi:hypothetical protein
LVTIFEEVRKLEPRLGISNAAALHLLTPCEVDIEFRSSLMAFRVIPREVVAPSSVGPLL